MSREAVDRMTKQIVKANKGKVSPQEAKKIAVREAIKHDRRKKR
jgi:hypothetical protein